MSAHSEFSLYLGHAPESVCIKLEKLNCSANIICHKLLAARKKKKEEEAKSGLGLPRGLSQVNQQPQMPRLLLALAPELSGPHFPTASKAPNMAEGPGTSNMHREHFDD